MVVDVKYKYEIGDMVLFTLTAYGSPKVYHGVVSDRWHSQSRDYYKNRYLKVYKINCLEKGMEEFTVSEELIIERSEG